MTRSDSSSAGHPGSRGWWGGEAGSVFSRLLTRVYPSMISSSSSTGQVTAEVIKGVMWGSSGGGVAILLFSILTFSSPISSGLVLPGIGLHQHRLLDPLHVSYWQDHQWRKKPP